MAERVKPKEELVGEVPLKMTIIHGLIAGFGFGAYASVITFVLAPQVGSIWYAPLPGVLFGLGTMTMQIIFGAFFGTFLTKSKKLTKEGVAFVSKYISKSVLFYGGIAFVIAGAAILAFPQIMNFGINTGIKIHNLDNLDIGFFLVVVVVAVIGFVSYYIAMRKAKELGMTAKQGS